MFSNVPENRAVWNNMEKYEAVGHATDDSIIWRMGIACCIADYRHTQNM